MRHLYKVSAGLVLTLAFALPTLAGQMPCPVITDPPPPPQTATATTEADGQIETTIAEAIAALLLAVF